LTFSPSSKPFIEKLSVIHNVADFDCGRAELNQFLQKYAWQNQQANNAQTYVAIYEGVVIGYYSLTVGSVARAEAPPRVTKGQPKHPIPVMILARLAIDKQWQRKGIGKGLLKDALRRTAQAADIAGIRAFLVHAKDERVKAWYEQFDFESSPTDELHLFLLLKDVKKILAES
jgi:GNAT superfamily N-acetyltransferase